MVGVLVVAAAPAMVATLFNGSSCELSHHSWRWPRARWSGSCDLCFGGFLAKVLPGLLPMLATMACFLVSCSSLEASLKIHRPLLHVASG
jgi:hypothetical protein